MKENRKLIQVILIFSGFFLIIITYFYYPKAKKNALEGSIIQNEQADTINEKEDNVFENVEYKGFYNFDNPFTILSKKAYIKTEDPNIIFMNYIKVTISMNDGRSVIITGDKGTYNKETYDCFFESVNNPVEATDGETIIQSRNLDLIATKDMVSIYNNVNLISKSGFLKADKVDYNFEAKYYKISMFNNEKVKIRLAE